MKKLIRIRAPQMAALQETTGQLRGVDVEQVIGAAIWAFAHQSEWARGYYLTEFWFHGGGEPPRAKPRRTLKERLKGLVRSLYQLLRLRKWARTPPGARSTVRSN